MHGMAKGIVGSQPSPYWPQGSRNLDKEMPPETLLLARLSRTRLKRDIKRDKNGHSGEITNLFSYIVFTMCNINDSKHFAMQQSFFSEESCTAYYCYFPRYTNPNKSPKAPKGFSVRITLPQLESTLSGRAGIRKNVSPATFKDIWPHCRIKDRYRLEQTHWQHVQLSCVTKQPRALKYEVALDSLFLGGQKPPPPAKRFHMWPSGG